MLGGKRQQDLALDRLCKANLFKPFHIEKPDYHLPYDAFLSLQQYQRLYYRRDQINIAKTCKKEHSHILTDSMLLQTIATSWEYVSIFLWTITTKHNWSRLEENSNLEVVFKKALGKEKNRKGELLSWISMWAVAGTKGFFSSCQKYSSVLLLF